MHCYTIKQLLLAMDKELYMYVHCILAIIGYYYKACMVHNMFACDMLQQEVHVNAWFSTRIYCIELQANIVNQLALVNSPSCSVSTVSGVLYGPVPLSLTAATCTE